MLHSWNNEKIGELGTRLFLPTYYLRFIFYTMLCSFLSTHTHTHPHTHTHTHNYAHTYTFLSCPLLQSIINKTIISCKLKIMLLPQPLTWCDRSLKNVIFKTSTCFNIIHKNTWVYLFASECWLRRWQVLMPQKKFQVQSKILCIHVRKWPFNSLKEGIGLFNNLAVNSIKLTIWV